MFGGHSGRSGLANWPGWGRSPKSSPDLAEWDYGDYEGQRPPDIAKQRPGWNIFVDGGPNGEPPQDISARADRLINRLEAPDGNVALFSHGHISRVLTARWLGFPVVAGQRFMLDTGTLSILRDDPRHPELLVIRWDRKWRNHLCRDATTLMTTTFR